MRIYQADAQNSERPLPTRVCSHIVLRAHAVSDVPGQNDFPILRYKKTAHCWTANNYKLVTFFAASCLFSP